VEEAEFCGLKICEVVRGESREEATRNFLYIAIKLIVRGHGSTLRAPARHVKQLN
jgi:hypothetical protein